MMIPHMLEPHARSTPTSRTHPTTHPAAVCGAQNCSYPTEGAIKPRDIKCDDGCCYADLFDVTRIVAIIQFSALGLFCVLLCCMCELRRRLERA